MPFGNPAPQDQPIDLEELRVDPEDGQRYTFAQVSARYAEQYKPWQIKTYWTSEMKRSLRFEQKDRVVCNMGERWIMGTVLDTDVEDPEDGERLPYVIKTDGMPGFEGGTISAPADEDGTICRERCWHAESDFELAGWTAPVLSPRLRKPLRFAVGDDVAIRVWDDRNGFEQWVTGLVVEVWCEIPGRHEKEGLLATGEAVPYKIEVEDLGPFLCHRDDYTLVRKSENAPKTPSRGISKRFEQRKLQDGTLQKFDHLTLRGRVMQDNNIEEE